MKSAFMLMMPKSVTSITPFAAAVSLLDKMNLGKESKAQAIFLRFLTLHDMQHLHQVSMSHRERVGTQQGAQALKLQLESKGRASFNDLITYQKLANTALVSKAISCLILTHDYKMQTVQLAAYPIYLLSNLQSLSAARCTQLTSFDFRHIVAQCPDLRHVDITRCYQLTNDDLAYMAQMRPNLQSLSIVSCTQFTGASLRYVAEKCKSLKILDIQGCSQLTNDDLRFVADQCSNLLNITWCRQVTGAVLRYTVEKCKDFHSLNIQGCIALTGDDLKSVVRLSNDLQCLHLQGCRQFSGDDLRYTADCCKGLQSLNIAWCTQVTRDDLTYIAHMCSALQRLDVQGCSQFTDNDLRYVAGQCLDLQTVVTPDGRNLSRTALLTNQQNHPPASSYPCFARLRQIITTQHASQIVNSTLTKIALLCFSLYPGMPASAEV